MRNSRSNFISVPSKPAKIIHKQVPRVLIQQKIASSQTERMVLVKEENLTFHSCSRVSQQDAGMKRDYIKAINYINSCHKFLNSIIEKNNVEKNNIFLLPMITNFCPIFPYLLGKRTIRHREKKEQDMKKSVQENLVYKTKGEERKCKSTFGVNTVPIKKTTFDLLHGDCEPVQQKSERYSDQITDCVKDKLNQFLNSLEDDVEKVTKKMVKKSSKNTYEDLDIVREKLTKLSEILCFHKDDENKQEQQCKQLGVMTPSLDLQFVNNSLEICSTTFSDMNHEETIAMTDTSSNIKSAISILISESSDINSDSDAEMNNL